MAEKIRGITIQINGDTSGLTKELSKVDKSISSTQKQLKDVEKLLKLDPTNTELLAQKQELLSKAVKETNEKLEELHKLEDEFKDAGVDEHSEEYQALQREIIATENSLKNLEEQASKSNVAMSKIGAVADSVASGADKVAKATKGLSTAAAGALASIGALAYSAATGADDLNTLAKQTGISAQELQKMEYASDLVDVSVDDITSSLKKMKKNMDSTSSDVVESWEAIGVSVRDSNGELRDSTEVFYEALEGLSKIENETERDTLAMYLFGKSADSLAGIVDDGGAALKELGDQAEELGLILDQETLDSLNEVNDQIDTMKANIKGTLSQTGAKALEALTPVIEDIVNAIDNLLGKLGEMDESEIKAVVSILAIVASISPLASAISKVATLISTITTKVIPALASAMSWLMANPVALVIAGVVALVALIATKGDEIQALLQKVDDFLQGVFTKDWSESFGVLGEFLNAFFAIVKSVWDSIKMVFDGIIDFIRGVFTGDWKRAWEGVKEIFGGAFQALVSLAKAPLNAVIGLINGLIDGINSAIDKINSIKIDVPDWLEELTGWKQFGFNLKHIGKIPYLAKGGIVASGSAIVGEAGPELLTMQGSKAMVQPLTNNNTTNHNLGGVNVVVYGAAGQDVHELADIIMDEIQSATARKGAIFA